MLYLEDEAMQVAQIFFGGLFDYLGFAVVSKESGLGKYSKITAGGIQLR